MWNHHVYMGAFIPFKVTPSPISFILNTHILWSQMMVMSCLMKPWFLGIPCWGDSWGPDTWEVPSLKRSGTMNPTCQVSVILSLGTPVWHWRERRVFLICGSSRMVMLPKPKKSFCWRRDQKFPAIAEAFIVIMTYYNHNLWWSQKKKTSISNTSSVYPPTRILIRGIYVA